MEKMYSSGVYKEYGLVSKPVKHKMAVAHTHKYETITQDLVYLTVLNFILNQFLYHFKIPCFIIFISLFLLLWLIISLPFM